MHLTYIYTNSNQFQPITSYNCTIFLTYSVKLPIIITWAIYILPYYTIASQWQFASLHPCTRPRPDKPRPRPELARPDEPMPRPTSLLFNQRQDQQACYSTNAKTNKPAIQPTPRPTNQQVIPDMNILTFYFIKL